MVATATRPRTPFCRKGRQLYALTCHLYSLPGEAVSHRAMESATEGMLDRADNLSTRTVRSLLDELSEMVGEEVVIACGNGVPSRLAEGIRPKLAVVLAALRPVAEL